MGEGWEEPRGKWVLYIRRFKRRCKVVLRRLNVKGMVSLGEYPLIFFEGV
jgi:hypothetical protein